MKQLIAGDLLKEAYLLITSATLRRTRKDKPFVAFNCRDLDGREVSECKIWQASEKPPIDTVVKVMGRVDDYEGHLHYVLDSWMPTNEKAPADFAKRNPFESRSPEEESSKWTQSLSMITNNSTVQWITRFVEFWETHDFPTLDTFDGTYKRPFQDHPAAMTVHHDYRHGLMNHTCETMKIAKAMCDTMNIPETQTNTCLLGAAIHDIGKLVELEQVNGVTRYSKVAKHYSWGSNAHVYIGSQMLLMAQMGSMGSNIGVLPIDTFLTVMNIILSHHGEFADVTPNTFAAQIVHMADNASTRINSVQCAFKRDGGSEVKMPAYQKHGPSYLIE